MSTYSDQKKKKKKSIVGRVREEAYNWKMLWCHGGGGGYGGG